LTRLSSEIEFHPALQDDPKQRRPDISLARAKLGWVPGVELDQGLRKTSAYFERSAVR
jgi:UDP-glucuronate decarboxylase